MSASKWGGGVGVGDLEMQHPGCSTGQQINNITPDFFPAQFCDFKRTMKCRGYKKTKASVASPILKGPLQPLIPMGCELRKQEARKAWLGLGRRREAPPAACGEGTAALGPPRGPAVPRRSAGGLEGSGLPARVFFTLHTVRLGWQGGLRRL